ncbi:MAG: hypothetical protein KDM64_18785, partial [Verrucomicrobiae bacterium]|nr:hypothetical protein [Verrucomicrobiae bacterium]
TRYLAEVSDGQINALSPGSDDYRRIVGGAWETMIGYGEAEAKLKVPASVVLEPQGGQSSGDSVIWIDGIGKAGLYGADGELIPPAAQILKSGSRLVTADLFMQGEYLGDRPPLTETRSVDNPREFAGYTYGYNHPLFAQRTHDILNLIAAETKRGAKRIHLIGTNGAGPWVAAAQSVAGDIEGKTVIDTGGFRFADLTSYRHPDFLPGSVKYGDLPGLLALLSDRPLWLAGEGEPLSERVTTAFEANGTELKRTGAKGLPDGAIDWLLK